MAARAVVIVPAAAVAAVAVVMVVLAAAPARQVLDFARYASLIALCVYANAPESLFAIETLRNGTRPLTCGCCAFGPEERRVPRST